METLELVFLFIHLLGMAAIVGGYFSGISAATKRLGSGITHGALLQLVSGALLLGIAEMGTDPVNHAKFGVKIAVVVVIMVLAWPRRRATAVPASIYHAIGLLALTNVAIAVFWK